ncbi:MAG: hypothetical protein ChlgKO_06370 [Chlamydiales bacterium]
MQKIINNLPERASIETLIEELDFYYEVHFSPSGSKLLYFLGQGSVEFDQLIAKILHTRPALENLKIYNKLSLRVREINKESDESLKEASRSTQLLLKIRNIMKLFTFSVKSERLEQLKLN